MEITSKKQLREVIREDKKMLETKCSKKDLFVKRLKGCSDCLNARYVILMRKTSYAYHLRKKNIFRGFLYLIYSRRFNGFGRRLGIECGENVFDTGTVFYHSNGTVINGNARVGKNCKLHGNNCIGNDAKTKLAPIVGDNVRLCVGAKIIGGVTVADGTIVAAGAVVLNDISEPNCVVAGVPARIVKRNIVHEEYLD